MCTAGITLAVALASLFLDRAARSDVAMTGELTLRGHVLPIGGVKEKLLAAHAAGVKRVIVPRRNLRDIEAEVPASVRGAVEVVGVQRIEEVLAAAFDPPLALAQPARL
ncbi:Lon protease-like protein 2 [Prototheca wickerhamii]|uniref:Lon protease-like protein 2 n=1 Tax=Prototheca wickerhamii TaxID=3111 RepID=A0AAD9IH51_PROWI|nr:Lon protease-like protein 2 [Prototheca wickerhamii]